MGGHQLEIPGEDYQVDVPPAAPGDPLRGIGRIIEHFSRDPGCTGALQPAGRGHVAEHQDEIGIWFAGLDVIGDRLTEVNVTSPTGIQEIDALNDTNLEAKVIDFVEQRCGA